MAYIPPGGAFIFQLAMVYISDISMIYAASYMCSIGKYMLLCAIVIVIGMLSATMPWHITILSHSGHLQQASYDSPLRMYQIYYTQPSCRALGPRAINLIHPSWVCNNYYIHIQS